MCSWQDGWRVDWAVILTKLGLFLHMVIPPGFLHSIVKDYKTWTSVHEPFSKSLHCSWCFLTDPREELGAQNSHRRVQNKNTDIRRQCSWEPVTVISSVQLLNVSDFLWPHGLQHTRPPYHHQLLEFTQTHVHWVGDAIQPSHPLLSPSPPAFSLSQHSKSFEVSQFFISGGQSIRVSASASILPMNIQDWFPLVGLQCN